MHAALMNGHSPTEASSFTIAVLDLTDLVRLQEERSNMETALRDAQKMDSMGRMAAGIAHEINTPTQFIRDNISFLQESIPSLWQMMEADRQLRAAALERHDPLAQAADAIASAADIDYLIKEIPESLAQSLDGIDHIKRLVLGLKEYSHPDEGVPVVSDIHHIIDRTLTICRNEWKYVATIEKHFAEDLPSVACLPNEIGQVFLNLIVNASHAIGDGIRDAGEPLGIIAITTHADDGWISIDITDTGSGIPEEILTRIFDPFFTTKGIGKGTGQGLALAWDVVVNKHQGTLSVTSAVGSGTTFTMRLPRERDSGQTSPFPA